MISLLGIYRPRNTPLHNSSVGFKLTLLVIALVLVIVMDDPITSIGIAVACLLLLLSTAPPPKTTLRGLAVIFVMAGLTVVFQLWRQEWERAIDTAADIIAISALALAITCSTPMEEVLDAISKLARPVRRILPPETIGLMFAMTLRAIPEAARLLVEARTAARARGMERSPRAVLIPAATRSVGFALQLGQALHARGIAEEAPRESHQQRKDRKVARKAERKAAKRPPAPAPTVEPATAPEPGSAPEAPTSTLPHGVPGRRARRQAG
jgi:biotin transport system permease protein